MKNHLLISDMYNVQYGLSDLVYQAVLFFRNYYDKKVPKRL